MMRTILVILILFVTSTAANAAKTPSAEELYRIIQQQQKQLLDQQEQIRLLQKQVAGDKPLQAPVSSPERQPAARVSVRNGLQVKSADGRTSFRVGGRLHVDAASYRDDKRSFGDGAEIRRARVNVGGKFSGRWRYRAEYDFSGNNVSVKDAWLGVALPGKYFVRAGQFQAPFSLEEMTSSNNITFMERALPNVFVPGYKTGLSLSRGGRDWSASGGVFGESVGGHDNSGVDDGWGVAGRVTYAPVVTKARLLHVGASAEYREPDAAHSIRYQPAPETHVTQTRLVNTDDISGVGSIRNYGLEAAARLGAITLQGEYILSAIERNSNPDLDFDGWYLSASWFLTGEHRVYSARRGAFRSLRPRHRSGAWELAARYSAIDLNDNNIDGGRENNWTLGINWYPTTNVRFMANYVRADADPSTAEVRPNEFRGVSDQPDFFQIRAQVNF